MVPFFLNSLQIFLDKFGSRSQICTELEINLRIRICPIRYDFFGEILQLFTLSTGLKALELAFSFLVKKMTRRQSSVA